jgi:hypothetical protein
MQSHRIDFCKKSKNGLAFMNELNQSESLEKSDSDNGARLIALAIWEDERVKKCSALTFWYFLVK